LSGSYLLLDLVQVVDAIAESRRLVLLLVLFAADALTLIVEASLQVAAVFVVVGRLWHRNLLSKSSSISRQVYTGPPFLVLKCVWSARSQAR